MGVHFRQEPPQVSGLYRYAMITAVLITNGRSSYQYALRALEEQSYRLPIITIKDMSWVEANNLALATCPTNLMIRVDDDMFLHPRAVEFMLDTYSGKTMHRGKLYEPHTKRIAGRVKIYNVERCKEVDGFTANRLGKIDRVFERRIGSGSISISDKRSPVGIHSCPDWTEQREYERLWGYRKSTRERMKRFDMPLEEQFSMRVWKIERIAKQKNGRFWEWLQEKSAS